jgi:hypothetical protein
MRRFTVVVRRVAVTDLAAVFAFAVVAGFLTAVRVVALRVVVFFLVAVAAAKEYVTDSNSKSTERIRAIVLLLSRGTGGQVAVRAHSLCIGVGAIRLQSNHRQWPQWTRL